jgi:hypothetical protein
VQRIKPAVKSRGILGFDDAWARDEDALADAGDGRGPSSSWHAACELQTTTCHEMNVHSSRSWTSSQQMSAAPKLGEAPMLGDGAASHHHCRHFVLLETERRRPKEGSFDLTAVAVHVVDTACSCTVMAGVP